VVRVPCLSLPSIFEAFGDTPVDLLHCDVQGAEEDLIAHPEFETVLRRAKVVLFGTHRSTILHTDVRNAVVSAGFRIGVEWPRNAIIETVHGEVKTDDGAILAIRDTNFDQATKLLDFAGVQGRTIGDHVTR
jgi:hypothetical protein